MSTMPMDPTDAALLAAFESCELDALPHADHVRIAWLYLRTLPLPRALAQVRDGLRRFATSKGAPGRYHETITVGFVLLIQERLARAEAEEPWERFAGRNRDLLESGVLERYWSPELLGSDLARRVFVMPDRLHAADGVAAIDSGGGEIATP